MSFAYKNFDYEIISSKQLVNGDTILRNSEFVILDSIIHHTGMEHIEYGTYITGKGHINGKAGDYDTIKHVNIILYQELPVIKVTNRGNNDR